MKVLRWFGAFLMVILAATAVAAYPYAPYGGSYGHEYTRSSSSEHVSVSESEHHRSYDNYCGYRYCHSTGSYDYGRSRQFSFSRSENYENERTYSDFAGYPYGYGTYGSSLYEYPYYDVGTNYGTDYRPFSEYYTQGYTSPYYRPYQYSRVGAYSGYRPYGY